MINIVAMSRLRALPQMATYGIFTERVLAHVLSEWNRPFAP